MDWYPLWNSLRVAAISCVIVFFTGIFAAARENKHKTAQLYTDLTRRGFSILHAAYSL